MFFKILLFLTVPVLSRTVSSGIYEIFHVLSDLLLIYICKLHWYIRAKQTVPHYYLSVEVNLEALEKIRSQLNKDKVIFF